MNPCFSKMKTRPKVVSHALHWLARAKDEINKHIEQIFLYDTYEKKYIFSFCLCYTCIEATMSKNKTLLGEKGKGGGGC